MRTLIKRNFGLIAAAVLLLAGLSVLLYPSISDMWNRHLANLAISEYDASIKKSGTDFKKEFEKAKEYNRNLSPKSVPDAFSAKEGHRDRAYEECLNVNGDGIMGYVSIPSIDVKLPINHYTTKKVLKKGAGHLCGSSLPVGEKGSHAVISAHRGLPSAELFTNLNLVRKGDKFSIHILNKKTAYEVDRIEVVKPTETKSLQISKGKDYITMMTCTPYGINSKRLLVRGHRIPYESGIERNLHRKDRIHIAMVLLCILSGGLLAFIAVKIFDLRKRGFFRYCKRKNKDG